MAGVTETLPMADTLQSPFCGNLRSTKFFLKQRFPMATEDFLDPVNHCWCRCTMQAIGPDGDLVHPDECDPRRGCYVSGLGG